MAKSSYTPKPADVHAANLGILKQRIKEKNLSGAYVFYGEEEYTKNFYYSELVKACGNKALNVKTLYAEDFTIQAFINACDTAPVQMMDMFSMDDDNTEEESSLRLVRIVSPKLDNLTQKDEMQLLSRIEDPDEGVIIVFMLYPEEQKNLTKKIYKQITDAALTVNFKHEESGSSSLAAWILRHFNRAKIELDRSVAMYMSNYVGCDMTTLKNEIDSCINYLRFKERNVLTREDIDFVCTKSAEAQVFDISSFTLKGDYASAMSTLKNYIASAKSKDDAIAGVFGLISKAVYEMCLTESSLKEGENAFSISKKTGIMGFVVKRYMTIINERLRTFDGRESYCEYASEICLEYDTLFKSSRTNKYELLREMIFKLACA